MEIVLINPNDYFLYLPLLPEVAAGVLEPRRVSVSLTGTLPHVRLVLGEVHGVDLDARRISWRDPDGRSAEMAYDRLVLSVGSVNKLLPIPGVAEHAHGFRGMPEALYLRDHVTRQIEMSGTSEDPRERAARRTFVVVGAGYTGTEVAAYGVLFTDLLARKNTTLRDAPPPRWLLVDIAPGYCRSWTGGCPARPTGCCANGAWRSARAPRSRRPPRRACGWTTASSSTPGR